MAALGAAGLLTVVGAAALTWLALEYRAATESEILQEQPIERFGTPQQFDGVTSVVAVLSVDVTEDAPLLAPVGWSGVVTENSVEPGVTLRDGTDVAIVDGISRRLATTDAPFFRPLAERDRGADVAALQALLLRWGYLTEEPPDTEFFHWRTTAAVRSLATDLGVPGGSRVFDPGWLIWLPEDLVGRTVETSSFVVGRPVPTPGETVVSLMRRPSMYVVRASQDGEPLDPDLSWTLTALGDATRLPDILYEDGRISRRLLDEVISFGVSNPDGTEPPARVEVDVSATAAETTRLLSFPATSVRPSPDGQRSCVFARADSNDQWQAIEIAPLDAPGSSVSVAFSPELAVSEVLHNPTEVLAGLLCP